MANPTKKKSDELIPQRKSVHVVFFSCSDCGEEVDDIKLCPECGKPMKVIDVVEKFGEEADKYLEKVTPVKKNGNEEEEEEYVSIDKEEPNIILMGDEDDLSDDVGIDPNKDDGEGLDVIFPDDDHDDASPKTDVPVDEELSKALEQLDSEEEDVSAEDFGFDGEDIPEL